MPLPSQQRRLSLTFVLLIWMVSGTANGNNCADNSAWPTTQFHETFDLRCDHSFLSQLSSCHCGWREAGLLLQCRGDQEPSGQQSQKIKDRRWEFSCSTKFPALPHSVWVNDDVNMHIHESASCPDNSGITGIYSRFMSRDDSSGTYNDRSYRIQCTTLPAGYAVITNNCRTTQSSYQETFAVSIGGDAVFVEITMEYDRGQEDRRMWFVTCPTCRKPWWSEWTSWSGSCGADNNAVRSRTRLCNTVGNRCNQCPEVGQQTQEETCNPDPLGSMKNGNSEHLPVVQMYLKHIDGGSAKSLGDDEKVKVVCQNSTNLQGKYAWCKNHVCDDSSFEGWFAEADRDIRTVGGHTMDTMTVTWKSNDIYSCQYNLLNKAGVVEDGKLEMQIPNIQSGDDPFYLPPFIVTVPAHMAGQVGEELKINIRFIQNDEENLFLFRNYDTKILTEAVENFIGGGFNVNHESFQTMHVATPSIHKPMEYITQPNVNLTSAIEAIQSMIKIPMNHAKYKQSMVFHVKGQSEVAIALEEHNHKFYLFLFGRNENRACSLHIGSGNLTQKRILTTSKCELSPITYRAFWIRWEVIGDARHLQLGEGNTVGQNILLEYEHTNYFDYNQIRVGTVNTRTSSTSYWVLFPSSLDMVTPDVNDGDKFYTLTDTKLDISTQNSLVFSLKAKEDGHVFLWDGISKSDGYRILIGNRNNTICGLRLTVVLQGPVFSQTDCTGILNATEYRSLWVSWRIVKDARIIRLGKGTVVGDDILLEYKHKEFFQIRKLFVGSHTFNEGTGAWRIPIGIPESISAQGYRTRITTIGDSFKNLEVVIPKLTYAHAGLYALMESKYNHLLNPTRGSTPLFTAAFEINVVQNLICLQEHKGNLQVQLQCEAVFKGGLSAELTWFRNDVEIPRKDYLEYVEENGRVRAVVMVTMTEPLRYTCKQNFSKPDVDTSRLSNVGNAFLRSYDAPAFTKNCSLTVMGKRYLMPNDTGGKEGGKVKLEAVNYIELVSDRANFKWRHGNKTYESNVNSNRITTSASLLPDGNTFFTIQIFNVRKEDGGTWSFIHTDQGEENVLGSANVAVLTKLMCYQQSYQMANLRDRRSVVCQAEQNADVERHMSWYVIDKTQGTIEMGNSPDWRIYDQVVGYETWMEGTSTTGELNIRYWDNNDKSVGNTYVCRFHFQNAFQVENSSSLVEQPISTCRVTIERYAPPIIIEGPGNPVGMLNKDMQLTWRVALNNLQSLYIQGLQSTSSSLVDAESNSCLAASTLTSIADGATCQKLRDSSIRISSGMSIDLAVLKDSPKVVLRGEIDEAGRDDFALLSWISVFHKFECSVVNQNVDGMDTFVCKSWYYGQLRGDLVWTNSQGDVIRVTQKVNARASDISDPNINHVTVPTWRTDTYRCTFRFAALSEQMLKDLSEDHSHISEDAPDFQKTCDQFVDGHAGDKAPQVLKSPRNVAGMKNGNVSVLLSYQKKGESDVQLIREGDDSQLVWSSLPTLRVGNYFAQLASTTNGRQDIEMFILLNTPAAVGLHQFQGVRYPDIKDGKGISESFEVSMLENILCTKYSTGSTMFELSCTATSYGNLATSVYWKSRNTDKVLKEATFENFGRRKTQVSSVNLEVELAETGVSQAYQCFFEFLPPGNSNTGGSTNSADNQPEFVQSCEVSIGGNTNCWVYIHPSKKKQCPGAYEGIRPEECEDLNCCFDFTYGLDPLCYVANVEDVDDTFAPTESFRPLRSSASFEASNGIKVYIFLLLTILVGSTVR